MFRFQVLKTFDNTVEYKTCEKSMINKEEATSYLKNYKYIAAYYAAAIMLFLSGPVIALSIYFATSEITIVRIPLSAARYCWWRHWLFLSSLCRKAKSADKS